MKLDFNEKIDLGLPESDITYYPNFFLDQESNRYFSLLRTETLWLQDDITLFGKTHLQPRLTALYANNNKPYSYSGITMNSTVFTPVLIEIKHKIEVLIPQKFTSCLLNLYRNGKDSNGWHADDEKELGKNPIIASVSFGAERAFHFRHKINKDLKHKLVLENGSLLLMQGKTQHFWKHQVPKTSKPIGERINLTFRIIR